LRVLNLYANILFVNKHEAVLLNTPDALEQCVVS